MDHKEVAKIVHFGEALGRSPIVKIRLNDQLCTFSASNWQILLTNT